MVTVVVEAVDYASRTQLVKGTVSTIIIAEGQISVFLIWIASVVFALRPAVGPFVLSPRRICALLHRYSQEME
jgi:hypothetical protein